VVERDGLVGWPAELAERYRRSGYWSGQALTSGMAGWADPDQPAVLDGPTRLTHGRLRDLVDGLAVRLGERGLDAGDTVLVQLPNCWEFVVLTLACLRLGVAPIMALPAHREHELTHLARLGGAVAIAVPDSFRDFDHQRLALGLAERLPGLDTVLTVGNEVRGGAVDLRALIAPPASAPADSAPLASAPADSAPLASAPADSAPADSAPADSAPATGPRLDDASTPAGTEVAVFLLSGGTTGVPKIIPRTHNDYAYNARRTAEMADVGADSVYLVALPAGHNFALACPGILGTLSAGGTVVMARSPEPKACFAAIARHRVTHTAVVPSVAQRWLDEAAGAGTPDLSSLRVLQVGGSRMPAELARRVRPVLGATLQQAFGMAEGLCNFTRLTDPDEVIHQTQGRPMCPDDEILIVDEADQPVADGSSGLLLTRGPYTLRGYYRAPEHNERAFTPDGWYRTGDVVHWHPSGNLVVDGRIKDVIVRGGEKISAEEVENLVYLALPSVARVAAVAAPDPALGERVAVFVVPAGDTAGGGPTLPELREALQRHGCAAFKLPEVLRVVDSLPVTAIGKINKNLLRAELAG
jgi:2,3-dihydroxybenzoate-AMP ligase